MMEAAAVSPPDVAPARAWRRTRTVDEAGDTWPERSPRARTTQPRDGAGGRRGCPLVPAGCHLHPARRRSAAGRGVAVLQPAQLPRAAVPGLAVQHHRGAARRRRRPAGHASRPRDRHRHVRPRRRLRGLPGRVRCAARGPALRARDRPPRRGGRRRGLDEPHPGHDLPAPGHQRLAPADPRADPAAGPGADAGRGRHPVVAGRAALPGAHPDPVRLLHDRSGPPAARDRVAVVPAATAAGHLDRVGDRRREDRAATWCHGCCWRC